MIFTERKMHPFVCLKTLGGCLVLYILFAFFCINAFSIALTKSNHNMAFCIRSFIISKHLHIYIYFLTILSYT